VAPRLQEDAHSDTLVSLCFPRSSLQRFTWPFGWLVEERTSSVGGDTLIKGGPNGGGSPDTRY
jgi:hypothetical protein